jgi:hypothetical protein
VNNGFKPCYLLHVRDSLSSWLKNQIKKTAKPASLAVFLFVRLIGVTGVFVNNLTNANRNFLNFIRGIIFI